MLLRTLSSVIGPMPKHRNEFNPNLFLKRVLKNSPIITMDSNSLGDTWREDLDKTNPQTSYRRDRLDGEMSAWEDIDGNKDSNDDGDHNCESDDECTEAQDDAG